MLSHERCRVCLKDCLLGFREFLDDPDNRSDAEVWGCQASIWRCVALERSYLEEDSTWVELLQQAAQKCQNALSAPNSARDTNTNEVIIDLLSILEQIDHHQTNVTILTLSFVLRFGLDPSHPRPTTSATQSPQISAAADLLLNMNTYFSAIGDFPAWIEMMCAAIKSAFDYPGTCTVKEIYEGMATGVLGSSVFYKAVRTSLGQTKDATTWRSSPYATIRALCPDIESLCALHEVPHQQAAIFALLTRLPFVQIDEALTRTVVSHIFEGNHSWPSNRAMSEKIYKASKPRRQALTQSDRLEHAWISDVMISGALRLSRTGAELPELGSGSYHLPVQSVAGLINDSSRGAEVRVESVSCLQTAAAISFIFQLLCLLRILDFRSDCSPLTRILSGSPSPESHWSGQAVGLNMGELQIALLTVLCADSVVFR